VLHQRSFRPHPEEAIAIVLAIAIGVLEESEYDAMQNEMRSTARLKSIMQRRAAVPVPGAANALFARVIEDVGFEAVYVTGAGIANMHLGAPDIGLTTMSEVAETVARIAESVSLPVIVDADTGFGNPVNTVRTVRVLERAGAAGAYIP